MLDTKNSKVTLENATKDWLLRPETTEKPQASTEQKQLEKNLEEKYLYGYFGW